MVRYKSQMRRNELPVSPVGLHLLADLNGVVPDLLCQVDFIEHSLQDAVRESGATAIFSQFHQFGVGQGVTGVILLQESHISIHTWPEHGFAAVDVFMCGSCQPQRAIEVLCAAFSPVSIDIREVTRGGQAVV